MPTEGSGPTTGSGTSHDRMRLMGTLLRASAVVAMLLLITDIARIALTDGVARVRDLPLFWLLRRLLEQADIGLVALSPLIVHRSFAFSAPGELAMFAGLAHCANFVILWIVVLPLAPVVAAAWLLRPPKASRPDDWFWRRAFPVGALVAFAFPAILTGVRAIEDRASYSIVVAATCGLAAILWLGLMRLLRDPRRVRRALAVGAAGSAVLAAVLIGATVTVAGGTAAQRQPQPAAAAGRPNVLLVSIDSLRADHVHSFGYPRETTPTLDRLAGEGVRFLAAFSPTSWTLPAHLTLLSALPPEVHGVVDDGMRLRGDAVLLSQVLWNAGYATAGFVAAPYLDAIYGYARGFDHYDDYSIGRISDRAAIRGVTSPTMEAVTGEWLSEWDANCRRRPFFLFLHLWDVHYDYTPPPPFDRMFDPDYKGSLTGEGVMNNPAVHPGMDQRDLEHLIALYDGEIRFTDMYLGKVVSRLEELGVLDDTLVVVTSDHGDEFFEHGRLGHQKALYDETTRVPLIMRLPARIGAGTVVERQVRLMDVAPTILALAGLDPPADFGIPAPKGPDAEQSLVPWIDGESDRLPELVAFGDLRVRDAPRPIASVRAGGRKLIRALDPAADEELYDLAADPGEQENLIGRPAEPADGLREQLAGWRERWESSGRPAEDVRLSEDHKERLRALGYMK